MAFAGTANGNRQRLVWSAEVVIGQTPLNVQVQIVSVIDDRPGSPGKRGDEFTQGHIGALDKILPNQLNYITESGPSSIDAIYPSCCRALPSTARRLLNPQ